LNIPIEWDLQMDSFQITVYSSEIIFQFNGAMPENESLWISNFNQNFMAHVRLFNEPLNELHIGSDTVINGNLTVNQLTVTQIRLGSFVFTETSPGVLGISSQSGQQLIDLYTDGGNGRVYFQIYGTIDSDNIEVS
jgi:hypothetical protein